MRTLAAALLVLTASACTDVPDADLELATEPAALTGPMPTAPVLGQQDVMVLIARVTDLPPPYFDSDTALIGQANVQLVQFGPFMELSSYHRATWNFTVRPPVVVPSSVCASGDSSTTQRAILAAAVAANDAQVNYHLVHQIILYANIDQSGGCYVGESGQPRQIWPITTGEGSLDASVTFAMTTLRETSYGTLLHEYGHTLRGAHLDVKRCIVNGVRQPIDHSAQAGQNCVATGQGLDLEPLDFISNHHYAMPRKLFWGWVTAAETITPTATNTFIIRSTEANAQLTRAIRVPVPASATHRAYVLEYRDGTGFDSGQTPGLYLYGDGSGTTFSTPFFVEPPPFADPDTVTAKPLTAGQSYTDPTYGMSFKLISTSGDAALVRVDLNETCTPGTTKACCYSPTATCTGTLPCNAAGHWGPTCAKKCVPFGPC